MSEEAGGYAFPIPNADFQTFAPKTVDEYRRIQSGMTLRDYFAAKALASIPLSIDSREQELIANAAYRQADAMLRARASNHYRR
ncbi:hypothetical protein [Pantoea ananatis]|uniref:hypothetical protein n=1 Tax=Pantoea ananas TaxID=553 RepID=UPI00023233B5|nr:hypothetical protein [Pantoea ananatis]AER33627.1 hypothetical protein PAGR_g3135 [Pantoea ananatis PA13]